MRVRQFLRSNPGPVALLFAAGVLNSFIGLGLRVQAASVVSGPVGGIIAAQSTWGGAVRVTNTVVVPAGGVLTLLPGTVVQIERDKSIVATNSSIAALGSKLHPIRFQSAETNRLWDALLVSGTNSQLTLRHVELESGRIAGLDGADLAIEDSHLHHYISGSTPIVFTLAARSLTYRRNHAHDYYEHLIRLTPVLIEDCLFENITGDGIDLDGAPPGSAIRNCTVRHGNGTNIDAIDLGWYTDGTPTRGVVVENCLLYDFPFDKGVSIGEFAENVVVRNCIMFSVDSGVSVKDSSRAILHNNTVAAADFGFRLYEKIAGRGGGHATAFNNVIWDVQANFEIDSRSTLEVTYSDVPGTALYPGAGNINVNPLFRDPAQRDYRFASNSPVLSAGWGSTNMGPLTIPGSTLVDTDADQQPDVWELTHDLAPRDPSDAQLDLDADGLANLAEFVAGTSPRDPLSALRFAHVTSVQARTFLTFPAVAGRSYLVEYREAAAAGAWTELESVLPLETDRLLSIEDPRGDGSARFYRITTPAPENESP